MMNQVWHVYDKNKSCWVLYTRNKDIWQKLKKKEPMAVYTNRSGRLFAKQYKFYDRSLIEEVLSNES